MVIAEWVSFLSILHDLNDLREITNQVLQSSQKTILLAIYTTQNQKRYIGVKLD